MAGCSGDLPLRRRQSVATSDVKGAPSQTAVAIPAKSVAVLPFENLSAEKDNAYFADGIQDEILTGLVRSDTASARRESLYYRPIYGPEDLRPSNETLRGPCPGPVFLDTQSFVAWREATRHVTVTWSASLHTTTPRNEQLAIAVSADGRTDQAKRAGKNYSHRCPKGNRQMRRVLNQAANAAVKAKGTIFAIVYRRLVPRLGHAQAIGAIAHRLCRLIWKILHQGIRYEERGPAVSEEAKKVRARKMIRELRSLGYRIELISPAPIGVSDFRPWLIQEAA